MDLSKHTVIYGGSFDPPHLGHQMAGLYILEAHGVGELWLLPTFEHPLGKEGIAYEHRLAMCALVAESLGPKVQVCRAESEAKTGGRTLPLLRYLQKMHPGRPFALALGADLFAERERWFGWEELMRDFPVIPIGRAGYEVPQTQDLLALPAVSSSTLRKILAAGSVDDALPFLSHRIRRYIKEHRLYGSDE